MTWNRFDRRSASNNDMQLDYSSTSESDSSAHDRPPPRGAAGTLSTSLSRSPYNTGTAARVATFVHLSLSVLQLTLDLELDAPAHRICASASRPRAFNLVRSMTLFDRTSAHHGHQHRSLSVLAMKFEPSSSSSFFCVFDSRNTIRNARPSRIQISTEAAQADPCSKGRAAPGTGRAARPGTWTRVRRTST